MAVSNEAYVYRFLNENADVIYVGSTKNIIKRILQHLNSGHLPNDAYHEVYNIECFSVVDSCISDAITRAQALETQFIAMWHPKYNNKGRFVECDSDFLECYEDGDYAWDDISEYVEKYDDETGYSEDQVGYGDWRRWRKPTVWPHVECSFERLEDRLSFREAPSNYVLYHDVSICVDDGPNFKTNDLSRYANVLSFDRNLDAFSLYVELLLRAIVGRDGSNRKSFEEMLGHCLLREPGRYQRLFVLGNMGLHEHVADAIEQLLRHVFGDNMIGLQFDDVVLAAAEWKFPPKYPGKMVALDKNYELGCYDSYSVAHTTFIERWLSGDWFVVPGDSMVHSYQYRSFCTTILMTTMDTAEKVRKHVGKRYPDFSFIKLNDGLDSLFKDWHLLRNLPLNESDAQYLLKLAEYGLRRLIENDGRLTCELS